MELWIRSQSKKQLANITGLIVVDNEIRGFTNQKDYYELGTYETKERAIEILDEIQGLLQPTITYKPIVQEEYNPSYEYRHFIKVDDNMEVKELSTFVYQMPEN